MVVESRSNISLRTTHGIFQIMSTSFLHPCTSCRREARVGFDLSFGESGSGAGIKAADARDT